MLAAVLVAATLSAKVDFAPYYTAQFIKGASCDYYEYSHEVRETIRATGRIYVKPGAKRVDTWPSGEIIDTSNPVSPSHATSTMSVNASAPISEWWFEQNVGFSYYRLDRRTGNCSSTLLYRNSSSGPPPQGFPAAQVPDGTSPLANTSVRLFDGSSAAVQQYGFNCSLGIAQADFRYYTAASSTASASPLVMTLSEYGYTRRRLATTVGAPRTPPSTQRNVRVELHNVREGSDSSLGLQGFDLNAYFLPLEPACQIGIQHTTTCVSKFGQQTPRAVDDVCGTDHICASRAFFDGTLEFASSTCKYANID